MLPVAIFLFCLANTRVVAGFEIIVVTSEKKIFSCSFLKTQRFYFCLCFTEASEDRKSPSSPRYSTETTLQMRMGTIKVTLDVSLFFSSWIFFDQNNELWENTNYFSCIAIQPTQNIWHVLSRLHVLKPVTNIINFCSQSLIW